MRTTRPEDQPPEWLEHEHFVRRLARALLADRHLAEDVVQSTWLAALENPPTKAGKTRQWLTRVVHNLTAKHWRLEQNRIQREGLVARAGAEGLPTDAELVNLRQTVLRALSELDGALQSTLRLHYLEGLSVGEMAERTGLPYETLRSRLKRGRARLRERLESSQGGDERYLGALVFLAREHGKETWVAGGATVSVSTLAIVGSLLGAALILVAFVLSVGPGHSASAGLRGADLVHASDLEVTLADPAALESSVDRAQRLPTDDASAPEVDDVTSSAVRLLEGRVFDRDREPIAGARVIFGDPRVEPRLRTESAFRLGWAAMTDRGRLTQGPGWTSTESDEAGTYRFALSEAHPHWTLAAAHERHGLFARVRHVPALGVGPENVLQNIFLLGRTSLTGVVVDEHGEPVVGAAVTIARALEGPVTVLSRPTLRVETGPDGTFATPAVRAGAYVLRVNAPGFETLRLSLEDPGEVGALEVGRLALRRERVRRGALVVLEGTVGDLRAELALLERGTPMGMNPLRIVGASELLPWDELVPPLPVIGHIEADGRYGLYPFADSDVIALVAGGLVLAQARLVEGAALPELAVDPKRLAALQPVDVQLAVVDAQSALPLGSSSVRLGEYALGADGQPVLEGSWQMVLEGGATELTLVPGHYWLEYTALGYARMVETLQVPPGHGRLERSLRTWHGRTTMTVRILRADGSTVRRAAAQLLDEHGNPNRPTEGRRAAFLPTTPYAGYRFHGLTNGTHVLKVIPLRPYGDPDWFPPVSRTIEVQGQPVILLEVIATGEPIAFRVTDGAGSGPYALQLWDSAGFQLRDDLEAGHEWHGATLPDELPPGSYTGRLFSSNGGSTRFAFDVPCSSPIQIDLGRAATGPR